jgi:secondary thiamine-phosphate synthase enzyme
MQTFRIKTSRRAEFIDVTDIVQRAVAEAGVAEGVCLAYVPHTTAGITINESADPAVQQDILAKLEQLAPRDDGYRHSEGNADSHIKASLMGSSVAIPVEAGRLALGTWQAVYFCEFDGPRSRSLIVKITKG